MISIIKNKPLNFDRPTFLCDENSVGSHLNDHSMLSLLNCYSFTAVIGRSGSGKSSLTIAMITQKNPRIYRKTHHHIIVFMPPNSIGSIKKNPWEKLDQDNVYNELTDDTIESAFNKIDKWSGENEKTILYIDDMTASLKRSIGIRTKLNELIYNKRHLKCNIIITAQTYVNIPLDVRKNITNLILFKPSKKEMESVFGELIETKKENYEDIMRFTFERNTHNFLFCNIASGRIFKNHDEIIINEDT